jgi:hydrogenase maturation protease
MKTLVLGLGNELLADDAVGILAARALRDEIKGQVEIVESPLSGLALLDLFVGYERAIVLDAIKTGKHPAGTILDLNPEDLGEVFAPSPHYSGLPEMLALAHELQLEFPWKIKIFALEVVDPYTVGGGLSDKAAEGIKELVQKVKQQLEIWKD